jgi:hypothetical protein
MIERKKLVMLNPREYEHHMDKYLLRKLEETPGAEKFAREFQKHGLEKYYSIIYTGSYLKVSEDQFPDVYEILKKACELIHLTEIPDLYIFPGSGIEAFAFGSENPIVLISRRTVDWLTEEELLGLIGHQVGHIKSGHMLYHDMVRILPTVGNLIGGSTLGIGKLFTGAIEKGLLQWALMSDLTADRAGLLTCQNLEDYLKLLMKTGGAPRKYYKKKKELDTTGFKKQAREFKALDTDSVEQLAKLAIISERYHPWAVLRASELLKWVDSGKYQKILDKADSEVLLCFSCGSKLEVGEVFCGECGEKIWKR